MMESKATYKNNYGKASHKDKIKVVFLKNIKRKNNQRIGYQFNPQENVEFRK